MPGRDRLLGMPDISQRLRAIYDLTVSEVREYGGRHEYDGKVQDLSPEGVRSGLQRLNAATAAHAEQSGKGGDYDEALLAVFERKAAVSYGQLELHRSNPYMHVANL